MCQRFQSRNSALFARQKLHTLKQRGSVTKYNLQSETIRSALDDLGETDAMHYYFMGLKPKIRKHFAENPNLRTDLSTMMNIAECLDNEQFHNASKFQPYTVKHHPQPESFP
ncbi:hypothetical protein KI688_005934 [Linnemannia hyalina]|uniref:Uncharacterized protein n=1 Tax=Linnemannia hyalina TaxID=64524 RepID=A0A9P7Y1T2_9FUNG|nr:hypothetical protein KI688_005934 [Linnemannia hyalina]